MDDLAIDQTVKKRPAGGAAKAASLIAFPLGSPGAAATMTSVPQPGRRRD
jgi:hypothetical protein